MKIISNYLKKKAIKKKLTPDAKKLVERYKTLNREMDRYTGSVFYVPNGKREKDMIKEQQDISEKMKSLGYELDLYY